MYIIIYIYIHYIHIYIYKLYTIHFSPMGRSLHEFREFLWELTALRNASRAELISCNAAISACEKCGVWHLGRRGIINKRRFNGQLGDMHIIYIYIYTYTYRLYNYIYIYYNYTYIYIHTSLEYTTVTIKIQEIQHISCVPFHVQRIARTALQSHWLVVAFRTCVFGPHLSVVVPK